MKLALQLAYKNLMGAGLRTWLNVIVLAFAFIMIIFFNGLMDGWNAQAKHDSIAWEYGNGQFIHENYDKYDPFTIKDGHGKIPDNAKNLTPILIQQASIYPEQRMVPILIKGIDINQTTLEIPVDLLKTSKAEIPIVIGERMAKSNKLKEGDQILMRWRDKNGTFDAKNVLIVGVFKTNVPAVDVGQVWVDLNTLCSITDIENEATILITNDQFEFREIEGWNFKSTKELMSNITKIIQSKKASSSILYVMLMAIALLAVFDTQVLSIFRRQKEIGTYVALGMTRMQVLKLFTVEGSMYSILACIFGSILGAPLLFLLAKKGIPMSAAQQDMGITVSESIHPEYGIVLILSTIALIIISATIVSFLPATKIVKMNTVDALKGKLQ